MAAWLSRWTRLWREVSVERLTRAVVAVAALLALTTLAFGGYYYWDRYHARGPLSPAEQAMQELEQAVRANPNDPDARVALAALYYENHLYDRAADAATQVLRAYPDHEAALLIAGLAYVQQDRLDQAVPLLQHFVELRRDSPTAQVDLQLETAYYFLGRAYVLLGEPDAAIAPLEAALRISPTDADALYQLGVAYQSLERCDDALAAFHRAVRLVPKFPEAYEGMAQCYQVLDAPLRLRYAQGMLAWSQGRYAPARAALEAVTEQDPDFAPAWLGLGLTYEKLGDLTAAAEALARAQTLAPDDLAVQHALGRVQAALQAQAATQEAAP